MKNRLLAAVFGILVFLPWLLLPVFIWGTFQLRNEPAGAQGLATLAITAHKLALATVMFSLAGCVFHAFAKLPAAFGRKFGWAFALVMLNMFIMPAYWYLHIWKIPGEPAFKPS